MHTDLGEGREGVAWSLREEYVGQRELQEKGPETESVSCDEASGTRKEQVKGKGGGRKVSIRTWTFTLSKTGNHWEC